MKNKRILFYCDAHIGDLIIFFPFIKRMMECYPENEYFHSFFTFDATLLDALPGIKLYGVKEARNYNFAEFDITIPTWLVPWREGDFMDHIYMSFFDHVHYYFKKICQMHNLHVPIDINTTGQDFDFKYLLKDKYEVIDNLPEKKRIMFFNQECKSGQTDNEPWLEQIVDLARKRPDIDFIYTNKEHANITMPSNVIYSPELHCHQGCDIYHNSFLSTKCQILVGRVSGPFIATWHSLNVNEINKTLICQHDTNYSLFYNQRLYKAKHRACESTWATFAELTDILNETSF